ncbi:MAG: hypothetical protein GX166_01550 [Clostridiaceae bacterium]|nr:hypothetical protein [Clostridiaceae bacterium]
MIKEFPINTFKNLDMVLVLPRYNGKWALCSDNEAWKCPESFIKDGEDAYEAACRLVMDECGVNDFELFPVWDFESHEERIKGRAYYAKLNTCANSSYALFRNLPENLSFNHELAMEKFAKAEVIAVTQMLMDYLDTLDEVRTYDIRNRREEGSVKDISFFEIDLYVDDAKNFVFSFPQMLQERFESELCAYRIFNDRFVLNISFSKFNPLFVVRFSIMR